MRSGLLACEFKKSLKLEKDASVIGVFLRHVCFAEHSLLGHLDSTSEG